MKNTFKTLFVILLFFGGLQVHAVTYTVEGQASNDIERRMSPNDAKLGVCTDAHLSAVANIQVTAAADGYYRCTLIATDRNAPQDFNVEGFEEEDDNGNTHYTVYHADCTVHVVEDCK